MTVAVGRVRPDPIFDVKLVAMGHNIVRGAAGASVLNAELLVHRGLLGAAVIVLKFGGTSVGDAEAIARTARIVAARARPGADRRRLGARRRDERAARDRRAGGEGTSHRRAARRRGAARAAPRSRPRRCSAQDDECAETCAELSAMFDELAHLAEALATLGDLTPRSLDAIAVVRRAAVVDARASPRFSAARTAGGARRRARGDDHRRARSRRAEPQPDAIAEACRAHVIPLVRDGEGPGDGRLHRLGARERASRRRSAAAAATTARRCSAPRCRPRRSRSGPTSTAC